MKTIFKFGLCVALICGLAFSTSIAQETQDLQEVTQYKEPSEIKELTIRNSGFRSRSTIVIRYQDKDKKIVEVIENGKSLPESEFPRYESVMRTVLELPQIDSLLPEIDRMWRKAESARFSEEAKLREMTELNRSLSGLESEVARRYQDMTQLQLMATLNNLRQKISESDEISQDEKIAQLRDVVAKMQELEVIKQVEDRHRRLMEINATSAVSNLIEEINKSTELSNEEKIHEIQSLLERTQQSELEYERRRLDLVELQAREAMKKMLEDINQNKDLTEQEKEGEFRKMMQEIAKINSEVIKQMAGIEEFKFELHKVLEQEGLLPKGKGKFVLTLKSCTIDGKQLPKNIHERILKLAEECIGNEFTGKTQIILDLKEDG